MRGTWLSTNAEANSLPTFDPTTKAVSFSVAAPHFEKDGTTVNTGFFRAFLPDALVEQMGITAPSSVAVGSFDVTNSDGSVVPFSITHETSPAGVLIESGTGGAAGSPFHYSSPTFTIAKAGSVGSSSSGGSSAGGTSGSGSSGGSSAGGTSGGSSAGGTSGSSSAGGSSGSGSSDISSGTSAQTTTSGADSGTVAILGGDDSLSWQPGAFPGTATVQLTKTAPAPQTSIASTSGFKIGSTVLNLTVEGAGGAPETHFAKPLVLHIASPGTGTLPAYSHNGTSWHLIPKLASPSLPAGQADGYFVEANGSIDIYTRHATEFATLRDTVGPTAPPSFGASYARGALRFSWGTPSDNSGSIARYELTLAGAPVYSGPARKAGLRAATGTFTLVAIDPSGNRGATATVRVTRKARPVHLRARIPHWAFEILTWRAHGRHAARPAAPAHLPRWYWRWARWRLQPLVFSS